MVARPPPSGTLTLHAALDGSEPLALLMQRLRQSQACWAAVLPLLPPGLAAGVRAGPLDEQGWSLLVDSGAVASKLRQLLPRLDAAARQVHGAPLTIRIRVQPREPHRA